MVYRRSLWSLYSLLTVIALLSVAKSSIIANKTAVRSPDAGSKCHVYNIYNYYNSHLNTGSNKKMEALLHRDKGGDKGDKGGDYVIKSKQNDW